MKDIEQFTTGLLETFGEGAVLILEHEGSNRFLQFTKRGESMDTRFLRFGFPDAPWSRDYFDRVRNTLEESGVNTAIQPTGDEPVRRYLLVDLLDAAGAANVARLAADALGIGGETFTIHYEGPVASWTETKELLSQAWKASQSKSS